MIDGRFAAHRRIDLRQQRGGDLDKRHTPHKAGCCEARHIAYDATAQCEQDCFAIASQAKQFIENKVQGDPIFVRFTIWQLNSVNQFVMAR